MGSSRKECSVVDLQKGGEGGDGSPCGTRFDIFTCRVVGGSIDLAVKKFTIKDVNHGAPLTSVVDVVDHLGVVGRKSIKSQVSEHALEVSHHGSSPLPRRTIGVRRPEAARGRDTWTRLWRRYSGSSVVVAVVVVIVVTIATVVPVASVSRVVGVAIRAASGVSTGGSKGTRHRLSDGERRGGAAGTSRSKLMARGLTIRARPCGALANHL
jgi:hypothetical protein